jgi:hypothetical protein
VNPSSITLVQGGSAQSVTLNLARTNYTGSVTLSTSALPSGVTATFTQPRTGNSGSISLKAASNATLASNQTITVTANGSGVSSVTATFSLTVNPPSIAISSVNPSSIALVQGGSAQSVTVSLTRTNYSGSVTLSTSALPSSVTATFTQPRTGNSGSISLKAASNATLVNNQTITITASGSGVSSVTATFSLTVNPPSIAISSVNPSSITLVRGGSAQSVTVSLTRTNYTGGVTLSTSALPSGVTATFTQPGTGNSGRITLKAASNATLVSNQTITITASGSGVSSVTATFSLTVNPPSIAISSVYPSSIALVRGGGAQSATVDLTRDVYTGSVTLSTSALPSGVTATFTQPGTRNSGSISLRAASNATLVSNQTITITATGSGVSYVTATFSLTVTQAPSIPNIPSIAVSNVYPSSITLAQGGSAQSVTVILTRDTYTGSVTLSTSALPSGVTATFTQPGTGNSGSISLKAACSATPVSNQTITVTASGSGVSSVTAIFSLTVNPPSIAISSVYPGSITLVPGGSAQSVTVSLTRTNYTGSVTLSTSALPSGVTATFTQPGTGNSGSISLKAASNATLVSNQTVTITASGCGVSSVTVTFSLTT